MFCAYFWGRCLPGHPHEVIPFCGCRFSGRMIIWKHYYSFGVTLGGFAPRTPPTIVMVFPIEHATKPDLADTMWMVHSRASGRLALSRYGHFGVGNQSLPIKNVCVSVSIGFLRPELPFTRSGPVAARNRCRLDWRWPGRRHWVLICTRVTL